MSSREFFCETQFSYPMLTLSDCIAPSKPQDYAGFPRGGGVVVAGGGVGTLREKGVRHSRRDYLFRSQSH